MSLTAILYNNKSPNEKIGKNLTQLNSFSVLLKEKTSVLNPVLIIESSSDLYQANYLYIEELGRYYYINDIALLHDDIYEIHAHVDVLETYKNGIKNNSAVIARQQYIFNLYLDDPDFMVYNYEVIKTIQFTASNDLSKTLQYVLVTNNKPAAQGG